MARKAQPYHHEGTFSKTAFWGHLSVFRLPTMGIPEGVRPDLFTPLYTSKENGQGIGLTMVQEILLGHGFDSSLESDGGPPPPPFDSP